MLCVIDMQPTFWASDNALEGVVNAVKEAKDNDQWIFIVEYEDNDPTHDDIWSLVHNYHKTRFITKDQNDGSDHILEVVEEENIKLPEVIRVCGVNTRWCVFQTVEGLCEKIERKSQVHVIRDACACENPDLGFPDSIYQHLANTYNLKIA